MSISTQIFVLCDHIGEGGRPCTTVKLMSSSSSKLAARRAARDTGWLLSGAFDYCPMHADEHR